MDKKILILGGSSYVGKHLFDILSSERAIATYNKSPIPQGVCFDSTSMSLCKTFNLKKISHAVILLGDTQPDSCVKDLKKSRQVNVESIEKILDEISDFKIKPIFTSTEFVFDGVKGNYVEEDEANPILTYGAQKLEIEKYIAKECNNYTILRFAKIFGVQPGDKTIITNWLEEISKKNEITCANDQVFSPIYIGDVVKSILFSIDTDLKGTFHVAGPKAYNRIDLLKLLLDKAEPYLTKKVKVNGCSIDDFNLLEKRPKNVSMIPSKLVEKTGLKLRDTEELCKQTVQNYLRR